MNTIKRFDAYMTFSPLSLVAIDQVTQIYADQGLEIQIDQNALEFSFAGRDLSDNVVKAFMAIAPILQQAEGELRCEVDDESDDPQFIFFKVSKSKRWRQRGHIVRGETLEVIYPATGGTVPRCHCVVEEQRAHAPRSP